MDDASNRNVVMDELIVNSQHTKDMAHEIIDRMWDEDKYLRINIKTGKQRSNTMNACLHLYCAMLADKLNNSGQEMVWTTGENQIEIPWTMLSVKDNLWRPLQLAVTKEESSTKPSNEKYKFIYETLNRHTATKLGISIPWPSEESKNQP
jgi:hypothetical protein